MNFRTMLVSWTLLGGFLPEALGQTYERLDVSTSGVFGNSATNRVLVSDDGRIVVFSTPSSNLVTPDAPATVDLFLRDRSNSTTIPIAYNLVPYASLLPENFNLEMTGDGRWITYSAWIIQRYVSYRYDREHGTTILVAPSLAEALPTGITPDGRYVALVGRGAPNAPYDAWRYDTQTGALMLCSPTLHGGPAGVQPALCWSSISGDGTKLVFASQSSDLVPNDTNNAYDVFLFDVSTATVERVSVDDAGAGGVSDSKGASITQDGSKVAFWSASSNLVPGGLTIPAAYVRDRMAGTTRLVSQTTAGVPVISNVPPRISADGRKVAFSSYSPIIIPGDSGVGSDLFLRDLNAGVTTAVTTGATSIFGEFVLDSIAGGGRWVTFLTSNSAMPNSSPNGGAYLADMGPACSAASYCTALPNSTGASALIGSQGEASLHFGTFALTASNLPPNAIAMFVAGTSAAQPGIPFGNGLRCIGGTLVGHGVVHASAGTVVAAQDFSTPQYAGTRAGDVLNFQCVYRDPSAGGAAFNSSNALTVTFCY